MKNREKNDTNRKHSPENIFNSSILLFIELVKAIGRDGLG